MIDGMDSLDKFVRNLQQQINRENEQCYSPVIVKHWKNPRNWGIMHDADGYGRFTGPCGDTMEISIIIQDGKISKCTFDTDGCGTTIACGSIITELAVGKSFTEAKEIDQAVMLTYCGRMPEESAHCALLAVTTLQNALNNYESKRP